MHHMSSNITSTKWGAFFWNLGMVIWTFSKVMQKFKQLLYYATSFNILYSNLSREISCYKKARNKTLPGKAMCLIFCGGMHITTRQSFKYWANMFEIWSDHIRKMVHMHKQLWWCCCCCCLVCILLLSPLMSRFHA